MASTLFRSKQTWRSLPVILLLSLGAPSGAFAGPVMNLSRSAIGFGAVALNFASPVQPLFITNTGDASLEVAELAISGAASTEFGLSGTCVAPFALAPAARCRIDVVMKSGQRGFRSAVLTITSNATPSAANVTLAGTIDPNYSGVPFLVPDPAYVDFGEQSVGSPAQPLTISILNATDRFFFSFVELKTTGGDAADFSVTSPCATDNKFAVQQTCPFTLSFTPQDVGPRSTELWLGLKGTGATAAAAVDFRYSVTGIGRAGTATQPVTVVEYYNQALDHYFITWIPAEIAILDAGTTIKGWTRTGKTLRTFPTAQAGTTAVCRFYIPPEKGDSHFFGRGTVECNDTGAKNPTFMLEDPAFMQMYLPVLGVCPANTTRIYRVFSNRPDANHRYMTDAAVRDQMAAQGWLAEGDGPDLVVMCAP